MDLDLKEMNQSYTKEKLPKDTVEKLKAQISKLEQEIKPLTRKIEDIELQIKRAEEDKETNKAKTLKDSLKAPKEELTKKSSQLGKLKACIEKSEKAIDSKMEELSKNPGLKAHLAEVIGKKFSREMAKKQKEKNELLSESQVYQKIKETAQENPAVMSKLYLIEQLVTELNRLTNEFNDPTVDPTAKAQISADITAGTEKLTEARAALAKDFHGTITREVIDKITSYADLDRTIKTNTRHINGLDKQIANYQVALQNLGIEIPATTREGNNSMQQPATNPYSRVGAPTPTPGSNLPDTTNKPKWYQFIKRFQNWNAQRKAEIEAAKNLPAQEQSATDAEKASFKDSMKYEVVRDYQEKLAKDLLKQAKAQNKEAATRTQEGQSHSDGETR